ncbi:hypothetical protein FA15DRAFT_636074 [Coprinopsis marcescibilis]|uniref:Regulator of volume decrease after cellular swelling-domain-containing protein n=1 Tax=Coprinopsis marcescibilis TaxID=230819 RepID=A0A5C3L2A6_COPMA|nr:hypothetical protein FA15DRAFT_636074 [Coprinopsis marcescibilis]
MPAVNLINGVPNFVTDEEYRSLAASTPTSFNDLPPILKRKEENVSVTLDPPVDGFSEQDAASGTLLVLTSVLAFVSATGRAFQVEYPSITLHAISRGGTRPSVYCQLDEDSETQEPTSGSATNGGNEDVAEQEYSDVRELSIIPSDPTSLDSIFEALSKCASLHPDKMSDDEDGDAFIDDSTSPFEIFTGDEDQELSEVGKAALAHLESIIDDSYLKSHSQDEEGITEGIERNESSKKE